MSDFTLDMISMIENSATDPTTPDDVKEWLLEKCVPVLCAEIRSLRGAPRPVKARVQPVLPAESPGPRPAEPVDLTPPRPRDPLRTVTTVAKAPGIATTAVPGLKAMMTRADLNISRLAHAIGVSAASVDNWRSGKVRPDSRRIPALAKALGCDESDLTGDGAEQ